MSSKLLNKNYQLNIAWMYPDLMSTYGDRGNIITLTKRCEWRGIKVNIEKIFIDSDKKLLMAADMIFMGGAQDTQQELVVDDLIKNKGKIIAEKIENGTPGLYICGAYQFLGKYYITADNTKLAGLGVLPLYTKGKGKNSRLIGNTLALTNTLRFDDFLSIIGFENHGGRTYLEDPGAALAVIEKGHGNNGEDKTEGIVYKNSIGTYFHGPLLPKNPQLADWLITKSFEKKYDSTIILEPLDDTFEDKARTQTMKLRLS